MKTIHNYYSNIPCLGKDCKYWGGEFQDEHSYPAGYNKDSGLYSKEPFISIWHGEHCDKAFDLSCLRKSIYDKAQQASDLVYKENKYKKITMMISMAGAAFDKIADEWRNMKCPYYEKEG